ncbi:MAG: PAS domain S-box protein [Planctomycetes bacterium]|nr:PAS domain S-box protein [Planctomycetota bacterium]
MKYYEEKLKEEFMNGWKSADDKPTLKNCYETVISVPGNIFYEWDMAADKVVYDGHTEDIIGFSADEIKGSMKCWMALIHPEDVKCFHEAIKKNTLSEEPVQLEYRIRKKNGDYIYVQDKIRFFTTAHDNHVKMVGFVSDISAFKEQQANKANFLKKTLMEFAHEINNSIGVVFICVKEVKRLFTQFLRVNASVNSKFNTINDTLQALKKLIEENSLFSDKGIRDTLNGSVDELCAGFGNLQKTIDGISGKGANILDYLEDTMNVSLHCKNLIKSLVMFMNQSEPVKTRSKINDVVKEVIALYECQADNRSIDMSCMYTPENPDVLIDVNQIESAVANVINNAFQAIEESEKSSSLTEKQKAGAITVETHLFKERELVEIVIKDSGTGIPKDHMERIFDPFFSKFKKKVGTGIGLSMAYKIVHMHNGTIKAESVVGKGTTVRITLPLAGEEIVVFL